MNTDKIEYLVTEIRRKQREADTTTKEFARSMRLQDFYPDAFKYGRCKTSVRGCVITEEIKNATFTITLGNGEKVTFPLKTVPKNLWPMKAITDYERGSH